MSFDLSICMIDTGDCQAVGPMHFCLVFERSASVRVPSLGRIWRLHVPIEHGTLG